MNKQGKSDFGIFHIIVIGVLLQAAGIVDFKEIFSGKDAPPVDDGDLPPAEFAACPTDGDTTLKVNVRNMLNTTGNEEFDVTAYIYDSSGALMATITDTTNPDGTNINCGDNYIGRAVVGNSDGGDNSLFVGKDYGAVEVNPDGSFSFAAERSTLDIGLQGRQHGLVQAKLYDHDDAGWMCNSDDSCTDYEALSTTAVSFTSTTNGTAKDVDSGGQLDFTINLKGTQTDTDFADAYVLLAIEGGTSALTVWQDPNSVRWDGVPLTEMKAQLNPQEADALAAYEWVYRYDGVIEDNVNEIRIQMTPESGQDPDQDLEFDFMSAGQYLGADGKTVKVGTHDDTTSNAVVFAEAEITIDITAD